MKKGRAINITESIKRMTNYSIAEAHQDGLQCSKPYSNGWATATFPTSMIIAFDETKTANEIEIKSLEE